VSGLERSEFGLAAGQNVARRDSPRHVYRAVLLGSYCTVRVTALEWLSEPEVAVTMTVLVPGGVPLCVAAL
jgi:hypothetical protein